MCRFVVAASVPFFIGLALRRFFSCQPGEIVPTPIILGGMFLAKHPSFRAVRGFRSRTSPLLVATDAVA
jgi:hypothetical protein